MTSTTWASPRYVQELATILGPQNRTQGSCDKDKWDSPHNNSMISDEEERLLVWLKWLTDQTSCLVISAGNEGLQWFHNARRNFLVTCSGGIYGVSGISMDIPEISMFQDQAVLCCAVYDPVCWLENRCTTSWISLGFEEDAANGRFPQSW